MNIPSGKLNPQKDAEIFRCYKRMLVSSTIFTTYIPLGLARNEKYENTRYQPTGIWIFHYFHNTSIILWFISSLKIRIWSFPTVLMGMWVAASFSHGWPWLSHGDDSIGTLEIEKGRVAKIRSKRDRRESGNPMFFTLEMGDIYPLVMTVT